MRYADPGQHRLADVLDAARLLRPVPPRAVDGGERWLKDPEEIAAVAAQIAAAAGHGHGPERAVALLAETEATADMCRGDPVADLGLGGANLSEPHVAGADSDRDGAREGRYRRGLRRQEPGV
ncbi:hypothetical protein [Streptomyces griseoluteus]